MTSVPSKSSVMRSSVPSVPSPHQPPSASTSSRSPMVSTSLRPSPARASRSSVLISSRRLSARCRRHSMTLASGRTRSTSSCLLAAPPGSLSRRCRLSSRSSSTTRSRTRASTLTRTPATQDSSSCRTEICAGRMSSTALCATKYHMHRLRLSAPSFLLPPPCAVRVDGLVSGIVSPVPAAVTL